MKACLSALAMLTSTLSAFAGQAPGAAEQPDIAVSGRDRFYTSDQFSNTVSVINPASNTLLGVIRLGDPTPESKPTLPWPVACPRNGLLARPPHSLGYLDRIELGQLYRYGN